MREQRKSIILIALAIFFVITSAFSADNASTLKTKVEDLLTLFPAPNAEERDKAASEFIQLGPPGIQLLCNRLVPPGTGDDTKARFALNGVAVYVSRSGAEEEREMLAKALIEALDLAQDKEVKAFLIRQLQIAGKEETVKPLKKYLSDKRLCEPAVQALLAIRTRDAEKVLLRSFDSVPASNRITLIKALGELRSQKAARKIIKYTKSRDDNLRRVALYALANIGHPNSEKALDEIGVAAPSYDRARAPSLYLLYAERLAESGRKPQCVRVCRKMIRNYTAPQESHTQCSALSILADTSGKNAFGDLLAAMDNPNKELRLRALELAGAIKGEEATAKWIERMAEVLPEARAEIITMLGRRGDKTALPAVLRELKSEDKAARLAAVPAAARLGGSNILQELMDVLQGDGAEESRAVKQVFMGFPYTLIVPEAAKTLQEMPPFGRIALIETLSERRAKEHVDEVFLQTGSEEKEVRIAALTGLEHLVSENDVLRLIGLLIEAEDEEEISLIQNAAVASANQIPEPEKRAEPFLQALEEVSEIKQVDLLKPLSRIGGEEALQKVIQETKNENELILDAAVLTLAEWPDLSAADELLNISRATEDPEHLHAAVQGYVRLVNEAELDEDKKFCMLKEVLAIPEDAENKSLVFDGLANVKILESLRLVAEFLDVPDLKGKAAAAAARISYPRRGEEEGLSGSEVISVLKKAFGLIEDPYEKRRLGRYIENLLKKEGFVPLFNGRDLKGWKGLVANPVKRAKMTPEELEKAQAEADEVMRAHWKVVDGILVFDGKGESLCTAKDYGDFELLVDWKIEENGDSGIYLRGSPQVQIWDTAQWPEGSGGLYNNKKGPSKPLKCVDNPIGEWNTFRIKMIGERVTVYLNDVLVVDNVVMENYWERDKPIYPSGQIELQAHSTLLYFRNIFIREITDEDVYGLTEEEIAEGFVALFNGETIVDADISEAIASGTMDGRDHPGLKRKTGHIGFLGHGSKVEFRNLHIKIIGPDL